MNDIRPDPDCLIQSSVLPIIPDAQAQYYQFEIANDKKSWLNKLTNNFRYILKNTSNIEDLFINSYNPVVLLGEVFENSQLKNKSYQEFKKSFYSIIWVTYRSHFRPIINQTTGKQYTSDVGWGCTIRVGQMLLLNTLKKHLKLAPDSYHEILKTIEENLISAPYSIHNIIQLGGQNKQAGDWYSPGDVSNCIKKLSKICPINNFKVLVAMDFTIYKDQLYACACNESLEYVQSVCGLHSAFLCDECRVPVKDIIWTNGVLICIPLMLGTKRIQSDYYESLKYFLRLSSCVGIIGEKPSSALYIVGYNEDNVILLDPHVVRKACSSLDDFKNRIGEYFPSDFITTKIKDLGSSMSLGFYFRNSEEFSLFEQDLQSNSELVRRLILVREKTPDFHFEDSVDESGQEFILL
jgi:cysteine protease ATG4